MIRTNFKKYAGYCIDHQDDKSGVVWSKLAQFWPEDLDEPNIGAPSENSSSCVVEVDGAPRFPTSTPEEALVSSMYFLHNAASFSKEAGLKIAKTLKAARDIWGVSIPDGFIESYRESQTKTASIEKYADDKNNLPVSTEDSFRESADLFLANINRWDVKDRVLISHNLEKCASMYGLDGEYDFKWRKSPFASEALMAREDQMREIPKHSMCGSYINKIASLRKRLEVTDSTAEVAFIAQKVDELDKQAGFNKLWNVWFPDPYESVVIGIEKEAEQSIDYSGLSEFFTQDVVDAIVDNPSEVIPTLPLEQRMLVEDYEKRSK